MPLGTDNLIKNVPEIFALRIYDFWKYDERTKEYKLTQIRYHAACCTPACSRRIGKRVNEPKHWSNR